jgi:hypothetical protein
MGIEMSQDSPDLTHADRSVAEYTHVSLRTQASLCLMIIPKISAG